MNEQQIFEWIKTAFADQPAAHLDELTLLLVWPDELAHQEVVTDILIRQAAQKRAEHEQPDRWRRSRTAHEFLVGKVLEARDAIRFEGANPGSFPANLIAWGLSFADKGHEPDYDSEAGRRPTENVRNMISWVLRDAIHEETNGQVSKTKACSYIAQVLNYDFYTIRSGIKQARIDAETETGTWVYNAVEIMVYDAWKSLGEKPQ